MLGGVVEAPLSPASRVACLSRRVGDVRRRPDGARPSVGVAESGLLTSSMDMVRPRMKAPAEEAPLRRQGELMFSLPLTVDAADSTDAVSVPSSPQPSASISLRAALMVLWRVRG